MGISLYFAWKKGLHRKDVKTAVILFALQLLLNVAWTYLFFYLHKPLTAFVEIIVLWLCIAGTMISLFRVSTRAGVLFIPYLIWVSFASVLNFFLWRLNT
jgi:tryptophan-rich sensory protein